LHNIFSRFSNNDTRAFFEELGVSLKIEDDGRVFPATNQASTIVDALTREVSRLKVKNSLDEQVFGLTKINQDWQVITDKNKYRSNSVLLATGGKSYPQLGSTGDGYDLARLVGHTIIEPCPALVPLELEGNWFKELQGVKANVTLTLIVKGKLLAHQTGELIFTHFGISGPVVLDLSRLITGYRHTLVSTVLVNFLPNYNITELNKLLKTRWQTQPRKTLVNSLSENLPKQLCQVLLKELTMNQNLKVNQIKKKDTEGLAERLSNWHLAIKKPRSFTESMVTAGGVPLDEVNTKTMESLKAKGLYLAGEILDIDGVSGGYNLQFAWSTGYLAGLNV
jgi:predicted Rossmann fold flavoprotein